MKKYLTAIVMVASIFLLTGCNDEPGSGDVKDNLKAVLEPCSDIFSISSVEKVNGVPGDKPGTYIVDYKYKLTYDAPTRKLQALLDAENKKIDDYNASLPMEHLQELIAQRDRLPAEQEAVEKIRREVTNYTATCNPYEDKCQAEEARANALYLEIRNFSTKRLELTAEIEKIEPKDNWTLNSYSGALVQAAYKECKADPYLVRRFMPLEKVMSQSPETILNGSSGEVTDRVLMIKTDKGWYFSGRL